MDRWIGIDEFVAVATLGSFTRAAKKLNTSVAQVSRRVKELEQQLNHQLLTRTTRTLTLTQEGKVFLTHARHLQHAYDDATLALRQRDQQPSGVLKLTAPVMYGEHYIMPIVSDFMRKYPKVSIEMTLSNEQLDIVAMGIDVAIRLGNLKDSSLKARKLAWRNTLVCAAPDYLASHGQPNSLSELAQHNCLIGNSRSWRFLDDEKERNITVHGNLICNSGWSLLDAACKGIGLVQLPHYYVQEALNEQRLVEVLPHFRPEPEGVWALYPPRQYMPTSLRLLLDYLALRFAQLSA
ncbi:MULTISPECIES: LysR family transcriptional regulator [Pseudoalteromonas]|uniref:LysR family transcriptional regulator n=1 Tax=Pseudoalteromonas amylolytica TaxID=1859457 RepID=A0A1S1MQS7_9GAMM|nr:MULTISPECIES: LysR substrate-binding domain-containing protein [Pseudoalteromonas]MCF6436198.1 LysR family transcriptional regulator [Pseudoalteromonas sp. MMG022]OHU86965.1 LysR family transcriptional regulator [Pseudoalteromonas sp. JW3]OHU88326.1 LysR family transcriptional regulator [Pseudoalteromonas amylolytica]